MSTQANANPSQAIAAAMNDGLNVFCARIVKHPTNTQRKSGPVKNYLVVVYGHLNPANPQQIVLWDKTTQPLVGFFAGLQSALVQSRATKDGTLYIPATQVSAAPSMKKVVADDGTVTYETLTTADGTPIHAFDGLLLKGIEVTNPVKAGFVPTLGEVRESKVLSGEGIEENVAKLSMLGRLASLLTFAG